MERGKKILMALLIISLVINISTFSKIGRIENKIQSLSSYISDMDRQNDYLHNSVLDLSRNLNDIKEGNKWITLEEFLLDIDSSSKDEIHLDLQWGFSDIEKDAKVYLLYGTEETEDFTKILATKYKDGIFTAPLALSPKYNYRYKIMAEGSTIKSGDIKEIPNRYYKPAPVMVNSMGYGGSGSNSFNNFDIEVSQMEKIVFDLFKPKRIQLKVFREGRVDKVLDLKILKQDERFGTVWGTKIESFENPPSSIVLEVEYPDGRIDSGEVWPEDKYSEKTMGK